jgi:hypothetical protein
MKNFLQYINAISTNPIIPKKAKMTTTILMPELDTTEGIYRSIIPSYVINGSEKDLRMLIVGLSGKMQISINSRDFGISERLITETDHFVFPFVSFPLRPIIEEIKAIKPAMKFSYYIDFNFYMVPDTYPFAKEYKGKPVIDVIEDNIKIVDQVICTNEALITYILDKLKENHPGMVFGTNFWQQKLYILPELMEKKTDIVNEVVRGRIKALIIGDEYQFSDMNYISGILKDFKAKYKETFELNMFGWDGVRTEKNYMKGVEFNYYKHEPFYKYFETIHHIAPTILIIPATKSKFNDTTKNYIKYLEFAHMNIPVLAPNIPPYSFLISTNQNGFLCDSKDDYVMQLETMLSEPAKFEGVLGVAYATATDYLASDPANIQKLKTIYFPGYGNK